MPKVHTLEEFITQAITCDNRLFERRQEQRMGWRRTHQDIGAVFSKNQESRPEPMQIDATHYKRLIQEEKQRRRQEGLCLYCGKPNHQAKDCTTKSNGYKARSMMTMEGDSENMDVQSQ